MVRGRCPRLRWRRPFGLINWGEDRVEKYPNSRCTLSAIPTCDLTFKTQPERLFSIVAEGNTLGTKPPNSFCPVWALSGQIWFWEHGPRAMPSATKAKSIRPDQLGRGPR